jgi:hypothetical protein
MKFANSCRLIKRDAVLDDTWHPLEGGPTPKRRHGTAHTSAGAWSTGCACVCGPRSSGSHWPGYAHDWTDLLAQQEADAE